MSTRLDLNRKDPWAEPPQKPERPWKCPRCRVGLSYVSETRARQHIAKCTARTAGSKDE